MKIHCCDLTIIRRNRFCKRYFAPRKSLKRNQLKVLVLTVIEFDNLGWHDVIIQSPFHSIIFFIEPPEAKQHSNSDISLMSELSQRLLFF